MSHSHNPRSTETLIRKSSWACFAIGAGLMLLAYIYQKSAEESRARFGSKYYKEAPDYWEARTGGLALIFIGLGCSLYANKLRKARTGE